MAKTEVRTELKLDDLASSALDKIKGGFTAVDRQVSTATRSIMDFAKQTAAVAIGVNIGSIFGGAKDALVGTFQAAQKSQEQMRELSKTVAGMSTVSGSVEKLSDATSMTTKEMWQLKGAAKGATTDFVTGAENVYSRLSAIAREAGVARGELVEAFSQTGKNTTRTNDQLVALIGNVASAARALPAPVKDIVEGFAEIEKNTISASNPLVEMVKQANLFRGHNEQIAMKLQAMGRQGMLNVMNKALKEMQERAKKMPMTLKEMGDQLGDMKEDVMKLIGGPMVAAITPAFRKLQSFIGDNRQQIEAYAKTIGTKVGEWMIQAVKLMEEGFKYIQTHAAEIKQGIKEGFDYAKSIFSWMLEHKGALAAGLAVTKVAGSGAIGGAVDGAKGVMDFAKALSAANAMGIGPLAAGSAGAAVSLGAFALAIGGVIAAFVAFQGYLKETGGYLNPASGEKASDMDAQLEAIKRISDSYETLNDKQIAEFDRFRAKALENASALGMNTAAMGAQIDAQWAAHRALADATAGMTQARDITKSMPNPEEWGALTGDAFARVGEQEREAAQAFSDSFNAAAKGNNTAALAAAVQIVAGSKTLQQSLLDSGTSVGLSLEKLAEVIGDKAGDFGKQLLERAKSEQSAGDKKPPPMVAQFNGGQTFNIKQDFRDQDPDRVALIFRRDVVQAAENRLQARTVLPFGGLLQRIALVLQWANGKETDAPANRSRITIWPSRCSATRRGSIPWQRRAPISFLRLSL